MGVRVPLPLRKIKKGRCCVDPVTGIGLGLQAVSLIGNLFGKSEATKRREQEARNQEAIRRYKAVLDVQKRRAISEGVNRIGRQAQGLISSGRSAAAARVYARGGSASDVEGAVIPIEAKGAQSGNEALSGFVEDTNRYYDNASNNADLAGLNQSLQPLPESPGFGDYALEVGGALTRYGLLKQPVTPTTGSNWKPPEDWKGSAEVYTPPDQSELPSGAFRMSEPQKTYNFRPEDVQSIYNTNLGLTPRYKATRRLSLY